VSKFAAVPTNGLLMELEAGRADGDSDELLLFLFRDDVEGALDSKPAPSVRSKMADMSENGRECRYVKIAV
jgi:hypothetical protein